VNYNITFCLGYFTIVSKQVQCDHFKLSCIKVAMLNVFSRNFLYNYGGVHNLFVFFGDCSFLSKNWGWQKKSKNC